MPMTTTGLAALQRKFATADARLEAALTPVVKGGVHAIGTQAEQNASFSSQIPGQEFETAAFLSGTVGFAEVGFPHAGKVRAFEGDGVAPEPFHPMVYGGPGTSEAMTHPSLGPAAEAGRPKIVAAVTAAIHRALT